MLWGNFWLCTKELLLVVLGGIVWNARDSTQVSYVWGKLIT